MSAPAFIGEIIQLLWPDVKEIVQKILDMTGISKYIQVDLGQKVVFKKNNKICKNSKIQIPASSSH